MAKKKLTPTERAQFQAERERMDRHIQELRELAQRAQAKLDAEKARGA